MANLKILIVEDDPVTLSLLKKRLKKSGYEVETAKNGSQAIDMVAGSDFDLVLTDLMMPGKVDGIGVLEFVKSNFKNIEVILLTAYASIENAVEAMQKGAADYLTKPVNFNELILRLERISTLKCLAKESLDLREAMDVTEKSAGQTIQDLELMVYGLKEKVASMKKVLSDGDLDKRVRIDKALRIADQDNID
jgi:DNA-binding NtrC family response regulator